MHPASCAKRSLSPLTRARPDPLCRSTIVVVGLPAAGLCRAAEGGTVGVSGSGSGAHMRTVTVLAVIAALVGAAADPASAVARPAGGGPSWRFTRTATTNRLVIADVVSR